MASNVDKGKLQEEDWVRRDTRDTPKGTHSMNMCSLGFHMLTTAFHLLVLFFYYYFFNVTCFCKAVKIVTGGLTGKARFAHLIFPEGVRAGEKETRQGEWGGFQKGENVATEQYSWGMHSRVD